MKRNSYGELNHIVTSNFATDRRNQYHDDLWLEARCMITMAVEKGLIPGEYDNISWDRKRRADGEARHLEIYDISPDARCVLLCIRATEGSKYGVRTTSKEYVIITAHGKSVRVASAPKSKSAKAAIQAGDNLGDAIAVCLGKKKLVVSTGSSRICYKIAAVDESGTPVSVYDKTPWVVGKTRSEKATPDHEGGYYVFPSIEAAVSAWGDRVVFAADWMTARRYTLLECECRGRAYMHDSQKMCISTVKPLREIAQFV